jgi:hypothetical protein
MTTGGKPDWWLVKLKAADHDLLEYERVLLEGLFGSRAGSVQLSNLEKQFYDRSELVCSSLYGMLCSRVGSSSSPTRSTNVAPRSDAEFWRIVDRVVDSASKTSSPGHLTWTVGARREGFEPPTARSVGWCSTSRQYASVLLVLLRSAAESSQTARVLSGNG